MIAIQPPQPRQVHVRMAEQCPALTVGTSCGWIITEQTPNFWPTVGPVAPITYVIDSDYNLLRVEAGTLLPRTR